MSGGIDSAYSACLLKKQGYKTVGFTFDLLPRGLRSESNPRVCCSAISMHRARRIADRLSIPHYVINMQEEFEHYVIRRFVDEYGKGRTPNPCVLCNRYIKFASFLEKALAMGADKVATGHYARLEETPRGPVLKKGKDRAKDQSYFLYPVPHADLSRLTFPLGSYTKETVRREFAATCAGRRRCRKARISASSPEIITGGLSSSSSPSGEAGRHCGRRPGGISRRGPSLHGRAAQGHQYSMQGSPLCDRVEGGREPARGRPKGPVDAKTPDRGRGQHAHPTRARRGAGAGALQAERGAVLLCSAGRHAGGSLPPADLRHNPRPIGCPLRRGDRAGRGDDKADGGATRTE